MKLNRLSGQSQLYSEKVNYIHSFKVAREPWALEEAVVLLLILLKSQLLHEFFVK